METLKPILTVSAAEWQAKQRRDQTAMIDNRPYIVLSDAGSPVYQPVLIVDAETQR